MGRKTDNKRSCFATEKRRRRRERKEKLVWCFCKLAAGCMMIDNRIEPSMAGFCRFIRSTLLNSLARFSSDRGKLFGFRQLPANTITSPQSFRPLQSLVTCWFMQTHREHFFLPRSVSQYQQCDCRANNESSLSVCRSFCERPSRALEVIRVRFSQNDGFETAQRGAFYRGRAEQVKRRKADRRFRRHLQADASD